METAHDMELVIDDAAFGAVFHGGVADTAFHMLADRPASTSGTYGRSRQRFEHQSDVASKFGLHHRVKVGRSR